DDDLVAVAHRREQGVQEALHPAAGDDELALRVVPVARASGGEVRDRRSQLQVARERQPAVRGRRLERLARHAHRLARQRQIGVEVLHPENRPARVRACGLVGRGGDSVDPEAVNGVEPPRLRDHAATLLASLAAVSETSAATTSASCSRSSVPTRWSPSNRVGAWPTASPPSTTRPPIAASTLRSSACDQTAPKAPADAPTTATGFPRSGFLASGLETQSSAFLSWPGIDELYSGVATRSASAPAIAARSAATVAGAGSTSSSSS